MRSKNNSLRMQNRRDKKGVDWKLYAHQLVCVLVRFFAVWFLLLYLAAFGIIGAWITFGILFAP